MLILKKSVLCIGFILMFVGVAVNLVIHELSHLLMMVIFGGQPHQISIGVESFVSGIVAEQFIPWVAMSSIYVPMIISFILSFVKNRYVAFFNAGFFVSVIINLLFGITVFMMESDPLIRVTYDIVQAADCSQHPTLFICFCCVLFCVAIWLFLRMVREILRNI